MTAKEQDPFVGKHVQEKPYKAEVPNGIARKEAVSAYYGNRKQVPWAAGGKANRSGE